MDIFDCIRTGFPSEVQKQIDSGVNLEKANDRGVTPIVEAFDAASLSGDTTILRMLLKAGASEKPLTDAVARKLEDLSYTLVRDHNSTVKCINNATDTLEPRIGSLTHAERGRAKTFLESAKAYEEASSSLRNRLPDLRARWSQQGEEILDEVVSYLRESMNFSMKGTWIRMESTVYEQDR